MKVKTLIVDDEPMARGVIRKHTGHFDMFEIIAECQNAIETINILNTQEIDLIFLDINMPMMNGFQFLDNLSEQLIEFLHSSKVVMLSSSVDPRDIEKAKHYPIVKDFISKPLSIDYISNILNKDSNK